MLTNELSDWTAPQCLRWLAAHTSEPNHYAFRADDWPAEVRRYADYEQISPDEYDASATDELRLAVIEKMTADAMLLGVD